MEHCDCPSGEGWQVSSCLPCAAGFYSASTESKRACKLCDAGTYNSLARQTICEDCAAGYFTNLPGRLTCNKCSAGKYSNNTYCFNLVE